MPRTQNSLNVAISRAIADAEVRRLEMSRTLDAERVAQILAAQAENSRSSPLGSDQLLALALDAASRPGEFLSPELDALRERPDPVEQFYLRGEAMARRDPVAGKAVSKAAPDWALRRAPLAVRQDTRLLAEWLNSAADLNAALWDHPALPVAPGFRSLMAVCVSALRERASQVSRTKVRSHFARTEPLTDGVTA